MEIQTDPNGFKYYDLLPEGWSLASVDDFYNNKQLLIMNKPYLVQSFHTNKYEAYRSKSKNIIQKLNPWLEDNRVFVIKG